MFKPLRYFSLHLTRSLAFVPSAQRASLSSWGLLFLALQVFWAVTVPPVLAQDTSKSPLIVMGDKDYPPYESLVDGEPVGINVDLWREIAKILGRPLDMRLYQWADSQARVQRGEAKVLSFMSFDKERDELYDFTDTTFTSRFPVFVQAEIVDQFDISDLRDKRIAIKKGGFPRTIIETIHPEAEMVFVENALEGFRKLLRGEVDGVMEDQRVGYTILRQNHFQGIVATPKPLAVKTGHIAVVKGNPALRRQIDAAISALKSSGKFDQIIDKWASGEMVLLKKETIRFGIVSIVLILVLGGLFYTLRVRRIIALKKEVTERKQVEEALRESEARLANAQRIACLGNWERNIETGELHWSDQVYDIFAITPEQFAGNYEAFLERVHPDDRELVEEAGRRALDGKAPLDIEYRIVRPDTSERVIHSHREVEFDAAGKPVRLHGTAQDITERKKAEREIAEKSALLETTLESMPQGLVVIDADLKLIAFNQRYVDLWGFPPGFVRLGMSYEDIVRAKAKLGAYGPVADIERLVRERMVARRKVNKVRRERTLPDGRVIAIHRDPMPDGSYVTTLTDITERKRAEEALRESEARLVNAQRIARLGDWERDLETGELHWSDQMYDIFAITPEQFAGTYEAFLERVHPDDRELVEEAGRRALDEKATLDIEFRIVRPDTSERVIHSHREVEFDAAGKPVRLHGTAQDITERKKAEREIAEKSTLLETTLESMPQGICVHDVDLKLVAFNQHYVDLMDYPPGFIRLGMPYEEISRFKAERGDYGPGDPGEQVRQLVESRRKCETAQRERVMPDGRVVLVRRDPMPDGGYVTTFTDITERKRAEEALRESEARLVNAQRIASLGNWERDLETGEVHWSDQMYDIFAITPEQFAGTHEAFRERVHPDDRELIQEMTRRALSEDAPIDVEYRIVRPDTSERVIHSQGEVEFDAAGKPVRLHGTAQDITERKSLEERIRQIHKLDAVGKLAGGVAHEFNNLLFVLRGNVDLLGLRINDNPELRQFLETMTRQIRRGSYLTHLLVAYARQQPLRPKEMNINDVVRETTKLLEGSLSDAIEIDAVCAQDLWTTMVDRGELESAIVNLALNAQDAMPEGGRLTVETANVCVDGESSANDGDAEPGEYVKLAVTDTGCGMAAVVAERAFEPFFTTKEVGKGTGLGLSMVYGFVKQSGGYVTIDSEPANGTTVSVYLPKAMETQA